MPRPLCCRRVQGTPGLVLFGPIGACSDTPDEVVMTLDELEALRLADLEELYQEQAAEHMGVSRTTFGRILKAAHRKVAEVLVHGKALKIEGGVVVAETPIVCEPCPNERGGASDCPRCQVANPGPAQPISGCQPRCRRKQR